MILILTGMKTCWPWHIRRRNTFCTACTSGGSKSQKQTLGVLALNVQDHVQRGEARSYSKLARMVNNHFKQKQREMHTAPREGDCHQGASNGCCSRQEACSFEHHDATKGKGKRASKQTGKEKRGRGCESSTSPRPQEKEQSQTR